jgi:dienelactone hydrolase
MDNIDPQASMDVPPATPQRQNQPSTSPTRRKKRKRLGMWLARLVLALCFLIGFYLSVLPSGRALTRAIMILPGLLSATQPAWQSPVDEPIKHIQTLIASTTGTVYLDIYEPVDSVPPVPGAREGVVVLPGVGDERQEPQLINFSETLAHAGVVVMDMTTPTLMAYRLDIGDEEAVVQAFRALQRWPGVSPERVGMLGFSGGGPLICFAAADARIRDQVAFVALFGSYFDTTTLLQAIGRRALIVDGQTQPWHPTDVPIEVLANTIAPYLPGNDASLLTSAFAPGGSGSLSADQLAQLAPGSAAAYHLLAGDQPGQIEANLAALSPDVRALLSRLSPARVVDQIRSPIYLLHDRSDQYVPFTESREFAAALARLHHTYDFAEFGIFQHVEVRSDVGLTQLLSDGGNLLRLVSEVVRVGS